MKILTTLGLDLGTNSLGWALIETTGEPGQREQGRIVDIGARIFSQSEMAGRDPKSQTSLAVARREARGMRRRRDRYLKRRKRLLALLTDSGLMPADEDERKKLLKQTSDSAGGNLETSVYALRAKALDTVLTPYELGRVLFQLNQRRGFKSNRKTDSNDAEQGKIAEAITKLEAEMLEDDARSFGEWLHKRRLAGLSVRARMTSDGKAYSFYPSRAVLEREFDRITRKQQSFHPELLSDELVDELREAIFYQRPLRPVLPGKCSYNPAESRAPKAHPLFQTFRLLKEINELEIVDEDQQHWKLSPDQRDTLVLLLRTSLTKQGKAPFSKLRKALKLGKEMRFNKESDNRKDLDGDVVAFRLSQPECFGNTWSTLPLERQAEITEKLRTATDTEKLVDWLRFECGLDADRARNVADKPMPTGFGRLGATALATLIDEMRHGVDDKGLVITEAEAAIRAYGRTNSETDPNRLGLSILPKYQEVLERHIPPGTGEKVDEKDPAWDEAMGRITNPTVHIALNQLRRVVNALIKKHGKPDRIAIELGRDLKLNEQKRNEANKRIGENTRAAIKRSQALTETHKQTDNGYNRLRLKLWEELNPDQPLNRACIYCGNAINAEKLFNGETDVDHILPRSKTLDDSQGNKILCCTACNREKGSLPPADVPQWRDRYGEILARAIVLPKNKRWRFAQDAMARFGDEAEFLARQVTDMQYISRLALTYLAQLYDAEETDIDGVFRRHSRVRALPGRMTEMLRRNWGLNELLHDHNYTDPAKPKNRMDHRHHAIDAAVIACTSRSLIQRLASASAKAEADGAERLAGQVAEPWTDFRDELRDKVQAIVVSHKPDHGTVSRAGYDKGRGQTAGKLHNDTAYGYTGEKDSKGNELVVRRIPISSFTKPADIMLIRTNEYDHSELRDRLYGATRDLEGKAFEAAVQNFVETDVKFKGIRHARIVEPLKTIPVRDRYGRPYKGYKGDSNHRYDVWQTLDGKWKAEVVSTFDAHRPGWTSSVKVNSPAAKKVLSLQQGDCLVLDTEDGQRLCRVVKFAESGTLTLCDHNEAGPLKSRDSDKSDPFKYVYRSATSLKRDRARQVRVDEIGQVFDPGAWWEKSPD
ncbi:type II CRISPR RNA-guided endonuclease Cas9 [Labrenzia sp. CE80]|uniref:type II CRISPR RNA-guided endonuclease Cas9 n=1 Tax=Labrenzia sp. CE80 TaxID=1788986 RepID=UPI00129AAFB9|nr:type II CRISPR RNA-guided endonuclease Cas9 [Labrenzia sp. CE80]